MIREHHLMIALFVGLFVGAMTVTIGYASEESEKEFPRNEQIICDQMCINNECTTGRLFLLIVDDGWHVIISKDGFYESIPVQQIDNSAGYKHTIWTFKDNRGFLAVGQYSKYAVLWLDKQQIMLRITHSTLNPQDQ